MPGSRFEMRVLSVMNCKLLWRCHLLYLYYHRHSKEKPVPCRSTQSKGPSHPPTSAAFQLAIAMGGVSYTLRSRRLPRLLPCPVPRGGPSPPVVQDTRPCRTQEKRILTLPLRTVSFPTNPPVGCPARHTSRAGGITMYPSMYQLIHFKHCCCDCCLPPAVCLTFPELADIVVH